MMHQSVWGDAHHSLTQEVCLFTCERTSEGPGSVWMNLSTDVRRQNPHQVLLHTSLISACCLVQWWF